MPFDLSVNLEYMFHEAGERLEDRMAAAAAADLALTEAGMGQDVAAGLARLDAEWLAGRMMEGIGT